MIEKLSKEELFEAVKQGVKEAILTMTESGDGYSGPIRKEEFFEAVKDGVFYSCHFPSQEDLKDIYYDAVRNAQ